METILVMSLLALSGVLETLTGVYSRGRLRSDDWIINLMSLGHLAIRALPPHPPAAIGIENDPKDPWYVQLYWPFVKASDPQSELAAAPVREPVSST